MPTIYLIRHGQKETTPGDPSLTELGKVQARQTGEYLKQFPITKIISSPIKRTFETADEISAVLGLPYTLDKSLVERMNWADDGTSKEEFLHEWVTATNNRDYTSKWGDSSRATGERMNRVIQEAARTDASVVLITHGGAILDYLRNTFGDEPLMHLKEEYEMGIDFQMLNCSINKVVLSEPPELALVNFTEHLSELTE